MTTAPPQKRSVVVVAGDGKLRSPLFFSLAAEREPRSPSPIVNVIYDFGPVTPVQRRAAKGGRRGGRGRRGVKWGWKEEGKGMDAPYHSLPGTHTSKPSQFLSNCTREICFQYTCYSFIKLIWKSYFFYFIFISCNFNLKPTLMNFIGWARPAITAAGDK